MKKENAVFICELPPPYGGVTIKNNYIIQKIFDTYDIKIIDLMKCKKKKFLIFKTIFEIIKAYVNKDIVIYGSGSYKRLEILLNVQNLIGGRKSLQKTVNIVMGGMFYDALLQNTRFAKTVSKLKINLVETRGMKKKLEELNIKNVDVFPNAKSISNSLSAKHRTGNEEKIKCVFFSQISCEKGVDEIINMNTLFSHQDKKCIHIDFYGHIVDDFKEKFEKFIDENNNVTYQGVFDATKNNVYEKLHEYDILLFPSRWKGEGVPGILIESKMAGIVPIVSDHLYNSEIVLNNIEGIVLDKKDIGLQMSKTIKKLLECEDIYNNLANGAFTSRMRYSLETYKELFPKWLFE